MVVVERFLVCDGMYGMCGDNYGVDNRHYTAKQHRKSAKDNGWVFIKGKDYCPVCAEKIRLKSLKTN